MPLPGFHYSTWACINRQEYLPEGGAQPDPCSRKGQEGNRQEGPWRPADWPRRVSVIGSKIAIQQVLDGRLIDWLDEVVVEARCT